LFALSWLRAPGNPPTREDGTLVNSTAPTPALPGNATLVSPQHQGCRGGGAWAASPMASRSKSASMTPRSNVCRVSFLFFDRYVVVNPAAMPTSVRDKPGQGGHLIYDLFVIK
jgi:hypothetical protein